MMIPNPSVPSNRPAREMDSWLDVTAAEMGGASRSVAHHALRGVLTALRDCLPHDDAHRLAVQLPILVRTLYYQGYAPSERPVPTGCDAFLAHVREEVRAGGSNDAEAAVTAVLRVLRQFVGEAETERILSMLPDEITALSGEGALAS